MLIFGFFFEASAARLEGLICELLDKLINLKLLGVQRPCFNRAGVGSLHSRLANSATASYAFGDYLARRKELLSQHTFYSPPVTSSKAKEDVSHHNPLLSGRLNKRPQCPRAHCFTYCDTFEGKLHIFFPVEILAKLFGSIGSNIFTLVKFLFIDPTYF